MLQCEQLTDLAPRMTGPAVHEISGREREGFRRVYSLQVTDNFQPIHREDRNTVRSAHRVPGWGGWQAPRWIEQAAGGGRTWCYYSQAWLPGKINEGLFHPSQKQVQCTQTFCHHSQIIPNPHQLSSVEHKRRISDKCSRCSFLYKQYACLWK